MAPISSQPPQTYSRLFRPWDLGSSSEPESISYNKTSVKTQEDPDEVPALDTSISESPISHCEVVLNESSSRSSTTSHQLENRQLSPVYPALGQDFYHHPPPQPTFGLDPYAINFMEHEYVRVLTEDAHLRSLSSRKQRPKKFKCPHCDVAFSNNGQLKGHIRIHTGERPFKCDVETCNKTFTRNEELTRHKRIHTGLRPYACSACGKKFGRRDHLKKHMKTHIPSDRHLGPPIFVPMYPFLYGY